MAAVASISLSVIGHFSCKNRVKFGNFVNFSGNNLKSYVVDHYLVFFIISFGLGLEVLASFNITAVHSAHTKTLYGLSSLTFEGLYFGIVIAN